LMKNLRRTGGAILTFFLIATGINITANASDLKPEELVAKHMDSIGTAATRAAATTRVVQGKVSYSVLVGGGGHLSGDAVLVSQGNKVRLLFKLSNNDYRGEEIVSDGDRSQAYGTLANHGRSGLAQFIFSQPVIVQEGLLGGVLSTAWPFNSLGEHKAKLEMKGTKVVDGHNLIDVHYKPKKSTDVDIHLFFDPETYQHVMTTYFLSIRSGLGHVDPNSSSAPGSDIGAHSIPLSGGASTNSSETATARQQETRFRLEERFSDYRTENGLTLPRHYRIQFSEELQNGRTTLDEWTVDVEQIGNGVGVDPKNFAVR
jgi:hypothetical protein